MYSNVVKTKTESQKVLRANSYFGEVTEEKLVVGTPHQFWIGLSQGGFVMLSILF